MSLRPTQHSPGDAAFNPSARWTDSTGWAWARNSPFRYYKQNQFEGGIATPAIVHWPKGLNTKPGEIVDDPAHLVDLLPTFADLAGARRPDSWPDRELRPLAGVSLRPILKGQHPESRPPIHLLFSKDRGLRDGDWKLVSFRAQKWELYNMAEDRTELHNLAEKHPDIVERMARQWTRMTREVLHAPKKEYAPVSDEAGPHLNREWTRFKGVK